MQELSPHSLKTLTNSHTGTAVSAFQRFNQNQLGRLRESWRDIVRSGYHAEPFFQPEWLTAYALAFNEQSEISAITTARGRELLGILPVQYQKTFFGRVPAHTLRSLSGIHSCRFDLIHKHDERQSVVESTWHTLRSTMPWVVIELLDVPVDGSAHDLLKLARQDGCVVGTWPTRKMPFMSFPRGQPNPFSRCPTDSRVYRTRLNTKLRKLRALGEVVLKVYPPEDRLALEHFIHLEGKGWKGRAGGAISATKRAPQFYDLISRAAAEQGYLRFHSLELNNEPISMQFGLLMNGHYYAPKVAYDERYAMYSPGQLLVKLVIEELSKRGSHTYDFMGPRAPWKSVWTADTREHYNLYIFRPTLEGRALHALTLKLGARARKIKHQVFGDPQA